MRPTRTTLLAALDVVLVFAAIFLQLADAVLAAGVGAPVGRAQACAFGEVQCVGAGFAILGATFPPHALCAPIGQETGTRHIAPSGHGVARVLVAPLQGQALCRQKRTRLFSRAAGGGHRTTPARLHQLTASTAATSEGRFAFAVVLNRLNGLAQ